MAARRGRQPRLWKMFPGIAVIGPEAKLPFSPGMNHADVKRLCFRNPAEFTARPSLLLTCVCKSPEFFQCLPVVLVSCCRTALVGWGPQSALESRSCCCFLGGKHLPFLPAAPNLILPAGIFSQERFGAQPRCHELWERYQCSGMERGQPSPGRSTEPIGLLSSGYK